MTTEQVESVSNDRDELSAQEQTKQESTSLVALAAELENAPEAPCIEWTMFFGVPSDKDKVVDEEKVMPATHGRLKVPLSRIFSGLTNIDNRGTDIYVSLVCIEIIGESQVRATDMLLTGSTEVLLDIDDPSPMNGLRIETLKNACLLVLNPGIALPSILTIPNLKNCMRIGRVTEIGTCSNDDCDKPVFLPRDGTCCFQHASKRAGVRVSIVGGDHNSRGSISGKHTQTKSKEVVIDPAEREALREANRRSQLMAMKKTAVLLANRRSQGSTGVSHNPFLNRVRGNNDLMDLGDAEEDTKEEEQEKLETLARLKRKRSLIEKTEKEAKQVILAEPVIEQTPVEPATAPERRKSLLMEFDTLVQIERGLN